MKARLYDKYVNEVVPALKEKHKYANVHQIPRMEKIVVNMGVSASLEKNAIEDAAKDLSLITGRKAVISKSRHSIANFKLRERPAHRLPRDAAPRRDVRIFRPAGGHGAAAHPRLSRIVAAQV